MESDKTKNMGIFAGLVEIRIMCFAGGCSRCTRVWCCCCFVRIENGMLRLANWLGLGTKTAAPNPCQSKIGVKATPLTVFVRNYSIGFSLVVLIIAPSEIRLQLSGS